MKKSFIQGVLSLSVVAFCCFSAASLTAQTAALTVQGVLKKSDGSAVPDDVYALRFALYDAEVGGNEVWFETISDVETTGGVYSAVLGVNGKTLDAPFDQPYYLSVKIGSSTQELLPRPRLSAAPYALALLGADNIVPSTGNIQAYGVAATNGISGSVLQAGGGGVESAGLINAQTGILASTGPINSGSGPFHGYGFLGDGATGYGSNSYGVASIWAGGQNVMNATNSKVTFDKQIVINENNYETIPGQWFYTSGTNLFDNNGGGIFGKFALKTTSLILCQGAIFSSDKRIKKDISLSNTASDLSTLLRLRVTDYKFKDELLKGKNWKKGFIAQEVREVIPDAVSTSTEVVPDIFTLAEQAHLQKDVLEITMGKPHGLKPGEKIRLITDRGQNDMVVGSTPSANTFTVSDWVNEAPEKVFVYGREVNDFYSVDYDYLFTMNISATQELARKVEALEKENAAFKTENTELRQLLEGLRADVDALKGQLR